MRISDRIGYLLLLVCSFFLIYSYGFYVLYETDFILYGRTSTLRITDVEHIDNKFIYVYSVDSMNTKSSYISTLPTKVEKKIGEISNVRVIPNFKIAAYGKFSIFSYLCGIFLISILVTLSILSIYKIFFRA